MHDIRCRRLGVHRAAAWCRPPRLLTIVRPIVRIECRPSGPDFYSIYMIHTFPGPEVSMGLVSAERMIMTALHTHCMPFINDNYSICIFAYLIISCGAIVFSKGARLRDMPVQHFGP